MIEITLPKYKPLASYRASTNGRTTLYWNNSDMDAYCLKGIKDAIYGLYSKGILKEQILITADTKSALYPHIEENLD
jgi:hypothetical protein